jgi:hypothetical protein
MRQCFKFLTVESPKAETKVTSAPSAYVALYISPAAFDIPLFCGGATGVIWRTFIITTLQQELKTKN